MNRRTFLILAGSSLAAGALSACSQSAPVPDATLLDLAGRARGDAAALTTVRPDLAQIRLRQAETLEAEVGRLCGHFEDGTTPQSCVSTPTPTAAAPDATPEVLLTQAYEQVDAAVETIPSESTAIVSRIHTELAILSNAPAALADSVALSAADESSAKAALEWEYGATYALEMHQAFEPPELSEPLAAALAAHYQITRVVRAGLAAAGTADIPLPVAGYGVNSPYDQLFLSKTSQSAVSAWHGYATQASEAPWRVFCVRAASALAVQSVPALEFAGIQPWRADFLHLPKEN